MHVIGDQPHQEVGTRRFEEEGSGARYFEAVKWIPPEYGHNK
jgi:hypothetical protein